MPLQANATVTRVAEQARPDDWDVAGGAGAEKWAGAIRGYYRAKLVEVRGEGTVTTILRRELILNIDDVDTLELDTNDVLEFTVDGEAAAQAGRAETIPRARHATVRADLQTSRIVLADV